MTLEQLEGIVRRPMRTIAADGIEEKEEATISGFVDYWFVEIEGPDALNTGLKKISTFEIASSQRVKREKTIIVPARMKKKEERKQQQRPCQTFNNFS